MPLSASLSRSISTPFNRGSRPSDGVLRSPAKVAPGPSTVPVGAGRSGARVEAWRFGERWPAGLVVAEEEARQLKKPPLRPVPPRGIGGRDEAGVRGVQQLGCGTARMEQRWLVSLIS